MKSELSKIKLTVQKRIALMSVVLLIGKFIAYYITHSVGILTDALESIINVITGFITIYSIFISLKPRDADHPFGHGKIESLSASIEGLMILLAGLLIIYEAIIRLFHPAEIQKLDIGIIIVLITGLINYILGYYSIRVGKKHQSIALIAGGKHLQSDTYSTIGLTIGLIILMVTHIALLDSVIALILGTIIIYTGYKILKETISNLMDEADVTLIEKLTKILWEHKSINCIEMHNLKIVKYGEAYHIDCDITLPWYMSVMEAHKEGDKIKEAILDNFSENIDLNIHNDYCKERYCKQCLVNDCSYRKEEFESIKTWTFESITFKNNTIRTQDVK
jgi:cation diffusion facilitator family transporter